MELKTLWPQSAVVATDSLIPWFMRILAQRNKWGLTKRSTQWAWFVCFVLKRKHTILGCSFVKLRRDLNLPKESRVSFWSGATGFPFKSCNLVSIETIATFGGSKEHGSDTLLVFISNLSRWGVSPCLQVNCFSYLMLGSDRKPHAVAISKMLHASNAPTFVDSVLPPLSSPPKTARSPRLQAQVGRLGQLRRLRCLEGST